MWFKTTTGMDIGVRVEDIVGVEQHGHNGYGVTWRVSLSSGDSFVASIDNENLGHISRSIDNGRETIIPAEPGYTVLFVSGSSINAVYPVIAWKIGRYVEPVTLEILGDEDEYVIQAPDKRIFSEGVGCFASLAEWAEPKIG